jgi:hypothetical protein
MQKFFIPLLGIIYKRLQKGFTSRQKLWAVLLGIAILVNFMFRAACPPERRFFTSPSSSTMYVCATPDVAKYSLPLGSSRSAQSHGIKGPSPL